MKTLISREAMHRHLDASGKKIEACRCFCSYDGNTFEVGFYLLQKGNDILY